MSHTDLATQTSTLGDRSHHKRELAAMLIEMTVRQIMTSDVDTNGGNGVGGLHSHSGHRNHREQLAREMIARRTDQIQLVIEFLLNHFITHDQPNYRKGGLLGVSHVMMALTTKRNTLTYEGINFLNVVIPIIQKCLDDEDSHVRYHACEALFNVINVARSHILRFFDLIFSHIQKLCDDAHSNVRKANFTVNRLLQDVACTDDHFPIRPFIKKLQQLMYHKSVNVRLLALNWFEALDAEPDIYMLTYLPLFLNSLFMMLIDKSSILVEHAQITMRDLCDEIELYLKKNENEIAPEERFDIELIVNNLVSIITSSDKDLQLQKQMIFGQHSSQLSEAEIDSALNLINGIASSTSDNGAITTTGAAASTTNGNTSTQQQQQQTQHTKKTGNNDQSSLTTTTNNNNNNDTQHLTAPNNNNNSSKKGGKQGETEHESMNSSDSSSLEIDAILDYESSNDDDNNNNDDKNNTQNGENSVTTTGNSNKNNKNINNSKNNNSNTITNNNTNNNNSISNNNNNNNNNSHSLYINGLKKKRGSLYEEGDQVQKLEALRWLDVFVRLGGKRLKNLYPNILNSVLFAMNDSRIQQQAQILNDHLMQLILESQKKLLAGNASKSEEFDMHSVLDVLIKLLENENCVIYTRIASLKWLSNLLIDLPINEFETRVQRLISVCFARLSDENDFVVDMDLCVIARIALHPTIYEQLLKDLLKKFYNNTHLLHFRGKLILTKLCQLLDCKEIYCFLSNLILKEYFGPVIDAANTKKFLQTNNDKDKSKSNRKDSKEIGKSKKSIDNNKENDKNKSKNETQKKKNEENSNNDNNNNNNNNNNNESKTTEDERGKLMIEELFESENANGIHGSGIMNDNHDKLDISSRFEMKISRRLLFVQTIVRVLNLILLTSEELYPLREMMKQCSQHENISKSNDIAIESRQIFEILYKTWCISPISLVSLCLLSQEYELAIKLIDQFKINVSFHKSVQFLIEIDELVHLLESPIFVHLRLQLLLYNSVKISNKQLYNKSYEIQKEWKLLFRIFNDLLTLLPDSDAYYQLKTRIETISVYNRLFTMLGKKENTNLKYENWLENAFFWKKFNENDIYYSHWMQQPNNNNNNNNINNNNNGGSKNNNKTKSPPMQLGKLMDGDENDESKSKGATGGAAATWREDSSNSTRSNEEMSVSMSIDDMDHAIVKKRHRSRKERFSKIDLIVASSDDLLDTHQLFEQFLKVNQQITLLKQKS